MQNIGDEERCILSDNYKLHLNKHNIKGVMQLNDPKDKCRNQNLLSIKEKNVYCKMKQREQFREKDLKNIWEKNSIM